MKTFTYRGASRTFSNRYHFNGGTPSTDALWTVLAAAIVAAEKLIYPAPGNGGATITEAVGYAAGSEVPVFTHVYSTNGTMSATGFIPAPGDVAATIRYSTGARSTKNHPIYLFNYYHAVSGQNSAGVQDLLLATQAAVLSTYGSAWISGFSDGVTTYVRASPQGAVATGLLIHVNLTHRDLPR